MIVSHKLRCIFIHLQKTGGSSIRFALQRLDPDAVTRVPGTGYKHVWARDLRPHLDAGVWNDYFKFGFVRNPWDRLVAWHNFIQILLSSADRDRWIAQIAAVREVDRHGGRSFAEFVHGCTSTFLEKNGERVSFARPQLEHLSDDNGELLVDFVGRFENLDRDFAVVLERLGRPRAALPHKNANWHRHYSGCYTPELSALVGERFRADVERFGYVFEPSGVVKEMGRLVAVTGAQALERTCRFAARLVGRGRSRLRDAGGDPGS